VAPLSKDYSEVKRISAIIDCFDVGLTRLFYAIIKREKRKRKNNFGRFVQYVYCFPNGILVILYKKMMIK